MKTGVGATALVFFLSSHLLNGQEADKASKSQKADDLAAAMERMRDDYQELMAECWGRGYYLRGADGQLSWLLSEAPDWKSCKKAETLKDKYRAAYKELLQLDRRRALFDDIPKYVDRP